MLHNHINEEQELKASNHAVGHKPDSRGATDSREQIVGAPRAPR